MGFEKGYTPWNKGKSGYTNSGSFKSGQNPWNKGLVGYRAGEKHHNWKGDEVGYYSLHQWVIKKLGQPRNCDVCETKTAKRYEWHNKSGEYLRELTDWQRLCRACHYQADYGERGVRSYS